MLWQAHQVQDNLRNREGKRVFYLAKGDQLTSEARDFLIRERVEILPAPAKTPKPEPMTHLNGDTLVPKTHPRIFLRGKLDSLESTLILCQLQLPALTQPLGELLAQTRRILRCEVLEEPLKEVRLLGLTEEELRRRSHIPQEYYGVPHFMPEASDGETIAHLNRLRCQVRETELAAAAAFPEGQREDLLQALNRMSSAVYLLMIQQKQKL